MCTGIPLLLTSLLIVWNIFSSFLNSSIILDYILKSFLRNWPQRWHAFSFVGIIHCIASKSFFVNLLNPHIHMSMCSIYSIYPILIYPYYPYTHIPIYPYTHITQYSSIVSEESTTTLTSCLSGSSPSSGWRGKRLRRRKAPRIRSQSTFLFIFDK